MKREKILVFVKRIPIDLEYVSIDNAIMNLQSIKEECQSSIDEGVSVIIEPDYCNEGITEYYINLERLETDEEFQQRIKKEREQKALKKSLNYIKNSSQYLRNK